MTKGVIVQLDYDTAHILKNDGLLISCPRDMRWQVGDVITISRHPRISLRVILIACLISLFLLAGMGITLYQIPTTYLEISVNPSLQLTLNRFDRVISVKGLNTDGDTLIQGVSYKNLSLDEACARLINRLDNNGYLTEATLQLIIANNSQKKVDDIEQNLRGILKKYDQFNYLQVSIKRYSNDEYLALDHPLPIMTIPVSPSQEPSGQQTEPPSSQPETSPSTPPSSAPHNDNWHDGDWRNGWWDWNCGW